jgi:hypothetical protein
MRVKKPRPVCGVWEKRDGAFTAGVGRSYEPPRGYIAGDSRRLEGVHMHDGKH